MGIDIVGLSFTHFHPANSTFSKADIINMGRAINNMSSFEAFLKSGGAYVLDIAGADAIIDIKTLDKMVQENMKEILVKLNSDIGIGKDTEAYDFLWKRIFGTEGAWKDLAPALGLDNELIIPYLPPNLKP